MNKDIKYLVERLFDDNDELFNNDESIESELNIADNLNDYVDLGLPSGTLWCKHNVGANNSEEYGDYLTFDEANEKYSNLPTKKLFHELYDECVWEWSLLNGVNGYKVISKNNSSIFLPAGGDDRLGFVSKCKQGFYWSSSILKSITSAAYYLNFSSEFVYPQNYFARYIACSVRQVKNKH